MRSFNQINSLLRHDLCLSDLVERNPGRKTKTVHGTQHQLERNRQVGSTPHRQRNQELVPLVNHPNDPNEQQPTALQGESHRHCTDEVDYSLSRICHSATCLRRSHHRRKIAIFHEHNCANLE
jgi:hypothetical protein